MLFTILRRKLIVSSKITVSYTLETNTSTDGRSQDQTMNTVQPSCHFLDLVQQLLPQPYQSSHASHTGSARTHAHTHRCLGLA